MIILGNHCVAIFLTKILIWAPFSQSMCNFFFFINFCYDNGFWKVKPNLYIFYFEINIMKRLHHSLIMLTLRLLLFIIKSYFQKDIFKKMIFNLSISNFKNWIMVNSLIKSFTKNICCWNTGTIPTNIVKKPSSDKCCTFWRKLNVVLPSNRNFSHKQTQTFEEYDYIVSEQEDPRNKIYGLP